MFVATVCRTIPLLCCVLGIRWIHLQEDPASLAEGESPERSGSMSTFILFYSSGKPANVIPGKTIFVTAVLSYHHACGNNAVEGYALIFSAFRYNVPVWQVMFKRILTLRMRPGRGTRGHTDMSWSGAEHGTGVSVDTCCR